MKNILFIAYYYPPLGGAGVQRTLKFAKYLNRMGYKVNILTVKNDNVNVKDTTLESDSDESIKIFRAKQKEIGIINKFINKGSNPDSTQINPNSKVNANSSGNAFLKFLMKGIRKFLLGIYTLVFIPDDKIMWKNQAIKLGLDVIKNEKIDIIISTSSPYTDHLVGYELKKATNVKWICDFRDPWVMHHFAKYSLISKSINKRLEKKVITNTDMVISVSQPIVDDFKMSYGVTLENKLHVITNGYDEDDFEDYNINKFSNKFIITYNGTVYGKESLKNFFIAVSNLLKENKIEKDKFQIRFVGRLGREAKEDVDNFNEIYNIVELISYLPHKESIKKLEESSSLLLILSSGEGCKGVYTGKIFEYLRSEREIIGIVPDGVARDLINKTNSGYCCYPDSITEIQDAIYTSYCAWKGDKEKLIPNKEEIKKYDREIVTAKLADLIDSL